MKTKWGVWCEVWGGVTGHRQAWLKVDGKIFLTEDEQEAKARASFTTSMMSESKSMATFKYVAKPYTD